VDGVSNYLHMVNDTHIIGLGAAAGANGGLGGGLQLSLFDVTDVKRPLLSASKVFGTSSSSSLATTDHKVPWGQLVTCCISEGCCAGLIRTVIGQIEGH
jgi:hypothetical protein